MQVNLSGDTETWVTNYLTIWQGFLGLTERELELTTLIALRYLELQASVSSEALLAELLLSPTAKQQIRLALATQTGEGDAVPMSANNLQNYLTSLREKGVLRPLGSKLTLEPRLIPQQTITFNFTVAT
jgi:hypothetical protein